MKLTVNAFGLTCGPVCGLSVRRAGWGSDSQLLIKALENIAHRRIDRDRAAKLSDGAAQPLGGTIHPAPNRTRMLSPAG
ncbi:MAG: hypothetical protein KGO03_13910 [Gemmatimonadota bacterium]|nr:hypothetical protein [Gemmatimonadota bacterium]